MRRSAIWVAVTLVSIAAACGDSRPEAAREAPDVLHERLWIEKLPRRPSDLIHVLQMLEEDDPIGAFAQLSQYKLTLEIFEYRRRGDTVTMLFPQDARTAKMKFRIERCKELREADMCLLVEENPWGGPKKYYGLKLDDARRLLPEISRLER